MRSFAESRFTFWAKSSTSPPLLSSRPAMTEISVVFPQPLGPTRNVSCPWKASNFTPRKTCTRVAPSPKSFCRSVHWTAGIRFALIGSTSKNNGGFEHEHPTQAQDAREHHDKHHAPAGQRDALPHQDDAAGREFLAEEIEELRRHPRANRKTNEADGESLQQNHADKPPVGDADGFDRAELLQVFNREQIKRLTGDHDTDNQRNGNRDPEIYRNPRVFQVIADAVPAKLIAGPGAQAGLRLD